MKYKSFFFNIRKCALYNNAIRCEIMVIDFYEMSHRFVGACSILQHHSIQQVHIYFQLHTNHILLDVLKEGHCTFFPLSMYRKMFDISKRNGKFLEKIDSFLSFFWIHSNETMTAEPMKWFLMQTNMNERRHIT